MMRHTKKPVGSGVLTRLLGLCIISGAVTGCTALLDFSGVATASDAGPADARPPRPIDVDSGPVCGNGAVEEGETCDDGNDVALDGCASDCRQEPGYRCTRLPSECVLVAACPSSVISNVDRVLSSCKSYYESGYRASGQYTIDVDGAGVRPAFSVLCDMTTAGGGWTILTNNVADGLEPSGCLPVLATTDALTCGTLACDEDFAVPAYDLPFTELLWAAHPRNLEVSAHNLFRWARPITLPNMALWSMLPDESNLLLPGLESQPLLGCTFFGPIGLRRVQNTNPRRAIGEFLTTNVVTLFDSDTDPSTPGNMGMTDTTSEGLDDFQDSTGCGDQWEPKLLRGSDTLIMIR